MKHGRHAKSVILDTQNRSFFIQVAWPIGTGEQPGSPATAHDAQAIGATIAGVICRPRILGTVFEIG